MMHVASLSTIQLSWWTRGIFSSRSRKVCGSRDAATHQSRYHRMKICLYTLFRALKFDLADVPRFDAHLVITSSLSVARSTERFRIVSLNIEHGIPRRTFSCSIVVSCEIYFRYGQRTPQGGRVTLPFAHCIGD